MPENWIRRYSLVIVLLTPMQGALEARSQETRVTSTEWTRVATKGETGCALGTPYSFFHRAGTDPNLLLIYFQGGGACWDWVSCSGLFDTQVDADELSEYRGIFDQTNPDNPFKAHEIVFVPYCTGDVHVGDTSRRYGDDPSIRPVAHRGYQNVRAVLTWVVKQETRPRAVVVAGTSAGAYGALFYMPEVERLFPTAKIVLLGDSGIPLLNDNPQVLHAWGADEVLGRLWQNGSAPIAAEAPLLEAYRQAASDGARVRLAQVTSDQDAVQGAFYLVSGSPGWREATYALLRDVGKIVPSFRSFIVEGSDHGLLPTDVFYTYMANDVYLKEWVRQLIRGEPIRDVRCARCTLE